MSILRRRTAMMFLLIFLGAGNAFAGKQFWQLTFIYGPDSAQLIGADPMPPMRKTIRTPNLAGAPLVVDYELRWLDGDDDDWPSTLRHSKNTRGLSPPRQCTEDIHFGRPWDRLFQQRRRWTDGE